MTESRGYTLDQLKPGESGVVMALGGEISFRQRLLEMGLTPGVSVTLIRRAPLGDPVEVSLRGYHLSLRSVEAHTIELSRKNNDDLARQALAPTSENTDTHAEDDKRVEPALGSSPILMENDASPQNDSHAQPFRVVIIGNPNIGKTTLFNALTGSSARIGNYPGTTVTRRVGKLNHEGAREIEIIDLPGTYSVLPKSHDEQIAIAELLGLNGCAKPDLVLVVLSASAIERSLYLLLQASEFGLPVVGVVNLLDEAERVGVELDLPQLSSRLGVPLLGTIARRGVGISELTSWLTHEAESSTTRGHVCLVSQREKNAGIRSAIEAVDQNIDEWCRIHAAHLNRDALALWLLSQERSQMRVWNTPLSEAHYDEVHAALHQQRIDLPLEIAQRRYQSIEQTIAPVLRRKPPTHSVTQRIDAALTHPVLGLLLFVIVMTSVFAALFDGAAPLMAGIETGFGWIAAWVKSQLAPGFWQDLIVDGVLLGVGGVVVFLPQIIILFLLLTLLEGCGYMARAAFMIDRVMKKLGLPGRAFLPMISGYACAIPAIMATRSLENQRDRLLTMMVIPLISCSARLPVYTLIIASLFPAEQKIFGPLSLGAAMMLSMYVISTAFAFVAAAVLGKTVLKGKKSPLLIELPPYRLPSMKIVLLVVMQKAKLFLKTAGTIIVVASIVLWFLLSYPKVETHQHGDSALHDHHSAVTESYAGRLGKAIEPVIEPLGFDWKIGIGLIGAFAAREVFVATMGLVYGIDNADEETPSLRQTIQRERRADGRPVYSPLVGISLMLFFMIAMQCISTAAIVKQESGSWKWMAFLIGYLYLLAYGVSFTVYQVGSALGWG